MTRVKIAEFGIIQKALAFAVVTFYETDAEGANTGVKATIYQAATGPAARENPQTLDGEGKLALDCYVDSAIMGAITGISGLTERTIKKVRQNPLEFSLPVTSANFASQAAGDLYGDLAAIQAAVAAVEAVLADAGFIAVSSDLLGDDNIGTVADSIASVNTVAGNTVNINTVAAADTAIGTVATNIVAVNAVGTNIAAVLAVNANATNINAVVANAANINTVAGIAANVTTVAGIAANVTAVSANAANINTVAANAASVATTAANIAAIIIAAADLAGANTIGAVATNIANVNIVAGIDAEIVIVANNMATITDAANNIPKSNRVATADPTFNDDSGDGYSEASIWVNTTSNQVFFCGDPALGAAVWVNVTAAASFSALSDVTFTGLATGDMVRYNGSMWVNRTAAQTRTDLGLGTMAVETASDYALKSYVDGIIAGLSPKDSCRVATTAALTGTYLNGASGVGATFTFTSTGVNTIDGVALALGDRLLVKNQASAFQNGIYVVSTAGAIGIAGILTRATGYDTSSEIFEGTYTIIEEGTANAGTLWIMTHSGTITVGTTSIDFTQLTVSTVTDAELAAIAGLVSAADRLPYFTGSGTAALATFTAGGRALVNSAGTADTFPYFSASNTVTLGSITAAGRNLIDDAAASNQRTTLGSTTVGDAVFIAANAAAARTAIGTIIGTDVQAYDAELAALAGLTSAADALPYFTGSGTAAVTTLSSFMRTVLDDTTAATAQVTLGVINAVLTGYTSGAGTVSSTDSILQAIQKLNGNAQAAVPSLTTITSASPSGVATSSSGALTSAFRNLLVTWTALSCTAATRSLFFNILGGADGIGVRLTAMTNLTGSTIQVAATTPATATAAQGSSGSCTILNYQATNTARPYHMTIISGDGTTVDHYFGMLAPGLNVAASGISFQWNSTGNFDAGSWTASGFN